MATRFLELEARAKAIRSWHVSILVQMPGGRKAKEGDGALGAARKKLTFPAALESTACVLGAVDPINRSATIDYQNELIHGEGVTQGEGMAHSEAHEAFTVFLCASDPPKGFSTGRTLRGDCAAEGRAESICFTCSRRVDAERSLVAETGSRGEGD